MKNGTLIMKLS
jgi:hypothetical protein